MLNTNNLEGKIRNLEVENQKLSDNIGGTFFFLGQNVKKYPESVEYVHSNHFSIANHSFSHPQFPKISFEQQKYELEQTNELIEKITSEPVTLFRPPYGASNGATLDLMKGKNMNMVFWNRDTEDWKTKNSSKILNYVVTSKSSGSIILLHESKEVVDSLPMNNRTFTSPRITNR